ncbi:hypothetical protein Rumeso_03596 [Rubellimicrobium mesophilum DSM 19309]|uniref:Uncharacterized protein n=1 Tax=Rubellimicrobium mesophilum DSM 19309 TaxID=442562 RepID=A0A017HM21_9RHOB|nr:hypothetical protein Rumeso_03596 [Rubellimicrobium mesophilum DSM 19309]
MALEALREAAAPLLTSPDAPVRLADLPPVWQAHLLDFPQYYDRLVPPGCDEVAREDWEELLDQVAQRLERATRLPGLFAAVERGPSPEDLADAPCLSPWSLALAWYGWPVLTGHVTAHPRLGEGWIYTSFLVGLDPHRRWARSQTRWYRLGEPMTEAHGPAFGQAALPVRLIGADDARVAGHLASLREGVSRLLEPLVLPAEEGRP